MRGSSVGDCGPQLGRHGGRAREAVLRDRLFGAAEWVRLLTVVVLAVGIAVAIVVFLVDLVNALV